MGSNPMLRLLLALMRKAPLVPGASIFGTPVGSGGASAASHAFTLPSGSLSGKTLVMIHGTSGSRTVTTPSGWALLGAVNSGSGSGTARMLHVFVRLADGSEGSTVTVALSSASASAAVIYAFENLTEVAMGGGAVGTSASPNPDVFTSGFGHVPTIWLAIVSARAAGGITDKPAGYDAMVTAIGSNAAVAAAHKVSTSSSEDPGAFTIGASYNWAAGAIAVR